jgi:hypothetical protein
MRYHHKKRIDDFFQCYRHQHLPTSDRWIIPLLDYMEDNMWTDTVTGGDLWNGRWTPQLLSALLGDASQTLMERRNCQQALNSLKQLTGLLQTAQRALYGLRHVEIMALDAKIRRITVISMQRKRKLHAARTLFAAWRIPYVKPLSPRRHVLPSSPSTLVAMAAPIQTHLSPAGRWIQHGKARTVATPLALAHARRTCVHKHRKREEHRSSKLKLRKLRNILLLCR